MVRPLPSYLPPPLHLPDCQIGLPLAGTLALYFDMGSRGLWIGIATMNLLQVGGGGEASASLGVEEMGHEQGSRGSQGTAR